MDFSKATKDNVTYQHYKESALASVMHTQMYLQEEAEQLWGSDEEGYDVVSRILWREQPYMLV